MVGYEFEHIFDNDWTFNSSARYGHLDKREIGPYPYGYVDPDYPYGGGPKPATPDNLLYRIGFEGNSIVDSFATDNHFGKKFSAAGSTMISWPASTTRSTGWTTSRPRVAARRSAPPTQSMACRRAPPSSTWNGC